MQLPMLLGIPGKSKGRLFLFAGPSRSGAYDFMAIPYYSWDNRGDAPMKVWISSK
jgi:DUF1680 family protein